MPTEEYKLHITITTTCEGYEDALLKINQLKNIILPHEPDAVFSAGIYKQLEPQE